MPRTFVARSATAVAPVAAIPTTAAHFCLWNGEPANGKTYTITSVGFTTTTSAAATMILQLLAHISIGPVPAISGTAASICAATDGNPGPTNASVFSAVTIVAATGLWHPVGPAFNTAALTATIGAGVWQNVRGLYTLPPGRLFSLATLGSTAAGASQLCVTWEEA